MVNNFNKPIVVNRLIKTDPVTHDKPDAIIDMDKLLEERVWIEPDRSFIRLEDIPNKRVFQIEKKLRQAVSAGASNYVKRWCCVFMDEANLRHEMMAEAKDE